MEIVTEWLTPRQCSVIHHALSEAKEKFAVFAIAMNNSKPVTFTAVGSESQEIASLTIKPQCC